MYLPAKSEVIFFIVLQTDNICMWTTNINRKGTSEKANDKVRYLKRMLSGPKVTIVASVACNEISLASASDVLP